MTSFTDEQLEMIADDTLGVYRASTLARELLQLRQQITPQAGEAFGYVYQKDHGNGIAELFFKKHKLTDFAGWEEIPLYRAAPPRPVCDGNHAAPACADPECWQRPSPVAPVWQPIETAPRDGTEILVRLEVGGVKVVHIAWYRSAKEWEESGQHVGGWDSLEEWEGWWSYTRNSVSQEKLEGFWLPTHWMPLPPDSPGAEKP